MCHTRGTSVGCAVVTVAGRAPFLEGLALVAFLPEEALLHDLTGFQLKDGLAVGWGEFRMGAGRGGARRRTLTRRNNDTDERQRARSRPAPCRAGSEDLTHQLVSVDDL